jgi:predicted  nucleic acid-binding Zn-ribbon protein
MKTALSKSLTKFEKDIFKKIEDVDNDIQDRFRKDIDVSALNKDIQNLIRKKDSMSEKIDELLEVIETVKYKI